MSLMDLYQKTYGAAKTAAEGTKSGEALINELLGEKTAAEASSEEIKTAASYEELGRQLARESFATDVLGMDPESEKTAEVISQLLSGGKTEEKTEDKTAAAKAPEKKADEKTASDKVSADQVLIDLGLADAPEKKAEAKAEDKSAEVKQAALNELAVRMAKNAKKGDMKSKAGLMNLKKKADAGNASCKVAMEQVLVVLKGGEVKEAGSLVAYLESKKKA